MQVAAWLEDRKGHAVYWSRYLDKSMSKYQQELIS